MTKALFGTALIVGAMSLLGGCDAQQHSRAQPVFVQIDPAAPMNSWPLAMTSGELVVKNGCIKVQTASDGAKTLIFPLSYTLKPTAGGWKILDRNGAVWGEIGDARDIGGGPVAHPDLVNRMVTAADRQRCPGVFWLVLPDDRMDMIPRNQPTP